MPSFFTSAVLNPIQFSETWSYITIAGQRSPGAIAVNGIRGFERETGWDKKKGKGTQGATLSTTTLPPAEGSITFQLWLPEHFSQWGVFRALLKYNPAKKKTDAAAALDIFHPSLADLNISQVVTHKISPAVHVGKGLYLIHVDLIEWLKPPPVSIVATTSSSKPNDVAKAPGKPPDPQIDRLQQQIAAQHAANDATTAGF
jgi:hypothetical protein